MLLGRGTAKYATVGAFLAPGEAFLEGGGGLWHAWKDDLSRDESREVRDAVRAERT